MQGTSWVSVAYGTPTRCRVAAPSAGVVYGCAPTVWSPAGLVSWPGRIESLAEAGWLRDDQWRGSRVVL